MSEHPVVAGYRGLDSAGAVQLGSLLAHALGEPLVIAGAFRYEPAHASARALPDPDNARRAEAARAALGRARTFARHDVEIREEVLPATGTAEALAWLARDIDACMLVLGRDTQSRVTRSLVPRAPCPVAVAPVSVPLPAIDRLRNIGVAYDGSPPAQQALVAAWSLARATGAELIVLSAGPTVEHAATALQLATAAIGAPAAVRTQALEGDAQTQLARASAELDLVVCGSRGRSRPAAALLGSVSAHLVAHAECAVVVVPAKTGRSPDAPLGISTAAVG
jgi:nucleotide-binding universal stress UspA family protein